MTRLSSPHRAHAGFSLVEMAIVLTIVGLLMATLLPSLTAQIEQQRRTEAKKQLAEIQQALLGFAVMNGRLPCPTTQTDPANTNYGIENGSCNSNPTAEGYLPWKTLGVEEIDPWGTKRSTSGSPWNGYWRYRVDRNFANGSITLTTGFGTCPGSSDCLTVKDGAGSTLTSSSERPIAIIYSTGSDLTPNGENSSFEGTGATYQSDVPSPTFDDILIWLSRPQLINRMVQAGKLP